MFNFFRKKYKKDYENKTTQVEYNTFLDVSFNFNKKNSNNFINRTPIPSLDLNNPTDLKIYSILFEFDKYKDEVYFNEYDRREQINEKTCNQEELLNNNNITNKIKNENIKTFISLFNCN
jgi:hypothetical protein